MATTKTAVDKTVWGNKNLTVFKCTSDGSATGIVSGFDVIDYAWVQPNSANTLGIAVKINSTNTTASVNGSLKVSSTTSGDEYYLYVIGH